MSENWSLMDGLMGGDQLNISRPDFSEEIALAVGIILKDDCRSRERFAQDFSDFVGERVSRQMLDAYSSKARKDHGVPAHRLFAMVAMTGRWDVLDALCQRFGTRIATRRDVTLMEVGNAHIAMRRLEKSLEEF